MMDDDDDDDHHHHHRQGINFTWQNDNKLQAYIQLPSESTFQKNL